MKTTIIAGCIRPERDPFKVAILIDQLLYEKNIEVDLVDLTDYHIPALGQQNEGQTDLQIISNKIQQADALVIVSPEYYGSIPGILKNTIDQLHEEFKKKPVAVATASCCKLGGVHASVQLQQIVLSLEGYPLPNKLIVPEVQKAFDQKLNVLDPSITKEAQLFVDELIWFAKAISTAKQQTVSEGLKLLSKYMGS